MKLSVGIITIISDMRDNYTYKEISKAIGDKLQITPPHHLSVRNWDKACQEKFNWQPKKRISPKLSRIVDNYKEPK